MKVMWFKDLQLQHQVFSTHTVRYKFLTVEEMCFDCFLKQFVVIAHLKSLGKLFHFIVAPYLIHGGSICKF